MPTVSDQYRALGLSTFAFTICFAVWTIFSIIGVRIQQELGLTETQFGLLVATPVLTGSISRIFLGVWTEQLGGRIVYTFQMLITAVCTYLLSSATTYGMFLVAGLGVGLAGGSFIVGIAYTSRWFSEERQGTGAWNIRCRECRRSSDKLWCAVLGTCIGMGANRASICCCSCNCCDGILFFEQG